MIPPSFAIVTRNAWMTLYIPECHVRVFVLGSGSSGNSLIVESDGERIIVDAGIGPVRAAHRMRSLGADLVTTRPPLGLFVTHDHGDHAAQALPLARAVRAPLFAHDGIRADRARRRLEVRPYRPGRSLHLGPFLVETMALPHDAPQVAVRVSVERCGVAIATDLGHAPSDLRAFLAASDLVLLESNYCPRLLASGPYPMRLRSRVGGPLGHLGNEQAAEVASRLVDTRVQRLVLLHLSRTNNTPELALDVVGSRARRLRVDVLPHGEPRLFDVERNASSAYATQLGFGF